MDPGSTLMKDDDTAETILAMLKVYAENPNIAADLARHRQRLDMGQAFKMILRDKGSKFASKIIVTETVDPEANAGVGEEGATVATEETMPEQVPQVPEVPTQNIPYDDRTRNRTTHEKD